MQFDKDGWLDIATEVDVTPNSFDRQGQLIKYIVLHGTAGGTSAVDVATYMKSTIGGNNPVSTHFVIGTDGEIAQCVPVSLASWGNGELDPGHVTFIPSGSVNPNLYTVSIEHCKPSADNSDQLTDAQEQASLALCKCLCETYGVAKQAGDANSGIMTHAQFAPINRARCPGPYPWDALWTYLEGTGGDTPMTIDLTSALAASYFEGSASIWKCKINGHLVGHAILDFYRKFGGDAACGLTYLGLPITDEQSVVGYPTCTYQRFERGVLVYDPGHVYDKPPLSGSVYLAHLTGGVGQDPRIASLQAQLDTNLQAKMITQLKGKIQSAVKALQ